ncbi:hypothetical protein NPS01_27490 [Nocardioides psychrotolerans]|uniref:Uncharacterized protein n=1 Tax=Nocardioides psychrotolerans TaxID=1005945 RepID=A0A1I3RJN4_9ACTN|nr:hypothetical protein [Nocardioides psychrotolerans]GEP39086.1 hypothetical protein NPS01_27490 [Nocardioides psychrotolerans]SFJ46495.1 hypothetical protein SAMN05216561_13318 [Nocardioides psychrotolerans]
MDADTTFASRSVREHLLRGALGLPLLVAAFALIPLTGPLALLLAGPAVVLLRGCPTCWALGLVQTRAVCALPSSSRTSREPVASQRG